MYILTRRKILVSFGASLKTDLIFKNYPCFSAQFEQTAKNIHAEYKLHFINQSNRGRHLPAKQITRQAKFCFRTQNTPTASSIQLLKWNLLLQYTDGVLFSCLILSVFFTDPMYTVFANSKLCSVFLIVIIRCFVDSLRYRDPQIMKSRKN